MTRQHVATQCKQIFSEYSWPETLISDSGKCYAAEAFTGMMKDMVSITSQALHIIVTVQYGML